MNGNVFMTSFFYVCIQKAMNLYKLILYSMTLLILFSVSRSFGVEFLGLLK